MLKGEKCSLETRRKISEANKGKTHSEEHCRKISEAKRKFYENFEHRKMTSEALRGHKLTEETKRRMSEAKKGKVSNHKDKKMSEEAKQRIAEATKGENNGMYGRKHTEEAKRKISENMKKSWKKGRVSNRKGKKCSVESCKRIKEANKRHYIEHPELRERCSNFMKKKWQNAEYREKNIKATLKGLMKRPTSYERKIIDLCSEHSLPFKYVGDGQIIIGYKNPDFIHSEGKNLLIEVYGGPWHPADYEEKRSNYFVKYGYRTLFLNNGDLDISDWKNNCLGKIRNFI